MAPESEWSRASKKSYPGRHLRQLPRIRKQTLMTIQIMTEFSYRNILPAKATKIEFNLIPLKGDSRIAEGI